MCGASATMCVALWKMKSTIATSKKGKVNWKLMINHASAFILFLIVFIGTEVVDLLTQQAYYYTCWLLGCAFCSIAMLQLTVLLWHLGTKDGNSLKALMATETLKASLQVQETEFITETEESAYCTEVFYNKLNNQIWSNMLLKSQDESFATSLLSQSLDS